MKIINFKVTDEEKEKMEKAARKLNYRSLASWMRKLLLDTADQELKE